MSCDKDSCAVGLDACPTPPRFDARNLEQLRACSFSLRDERTVGLVARGWLVLLERRAKLDDALIGQLVGKYERELPGSGNARIWRFMDSLLRCRPVVVELACEGALDAASSSADAGRQAACATFEVDELPASAATDPERLLLDREQGLHRMMSDEACVLALTCIERLLRPACTAARQHHFAQVPAAAWYPAARWNLPPSREAGPAAALCRLVALMLVGAQGIQCWKRDDLEVLEVKPEQLCEQDIPRLANLFRDLPAAWRVTCTDESSALEGFRQARSLHGSVKRATCKTIDCYHGLSRILDLPALPGELSNSLKIPAHVPRSSPPLPERAEQERLVRTLASWLSTATEQLRRSTGHRLLRERCERLLDRRPTRAG